MAYTEQEARRLVIEAGNKLFDLGLVTRTWGNISARISDTQFVITPSGKPYDLMTMDQIVVANIDDWNYEGDLRPSDEIGIHADAYQMRPEVNFVIHTHQQKACVVCATGAEISDVPEEYKPVLGSFIPCGEYGLPSTKKLCRGVKSAAVKHPKSKAVIMKHHGAACFGKDYDDAFNIALALEKVCQTTIEKKYLEKSNASNFDENAMRDYYLNIEDSNLKMPKVIKDLGCSVRDVNSFKLTLNNGEIYDVPLDLNADNKDIPEVAKIHSAIYKSSDVTNIAHLKDLDVVALSLVGKTMKPYLDDYSQLSGTTIKVAQWDELNSDISANSIVKNLKGRNAVLIKGLGAICTANNEGDLIATNIITAKGCESEISVKIFGMGKPINFLHRFIMRKVYLLKYSKQADA
ncbi:MAG: class II aldolase/adducin family protein [Clostridia bacterium]|nr:class II aldolase/adducin family protein [Clostridia bacterium]